MPGIDGLSGAESIEASPSRSVLGQIRSGFGGSPSTTRALSFDHGALSHNVGHHIFPPTSGSPGERAGVDVDAGTIGCQYEGQVVKTLRHISSYSSSGGGGGCVGGGGGGVGVVVERMPTVFTTCLVTGQPIDNGIDIVRTASSHGLPDLRKIFCPIVGPRAAWSKDKAPRGWREQAKSDRIGRRLET